MSRNVPVRRSMGDTFSSGVIALVVGFVVLAVVLVLVVTGTYGFGLFNQKSANFRGETDKRNKVEANGSFRIAAYDHFFDLCTSVQAVEAMIKNSQGELETNPPADRVVQVNANIAAQRNQRAATIAQYNNDSRKDYTIGQFQSSKLPYQLDPTAEATTCVA